MPPSLPWARCSLSRSLPLVSSRAHYRYRRRQARTKCPKRLFLAISRDRASEAAAESASSFLPSCCVRRRREPRFLIELLTLGLISDALSTSEERSRLLVDDKLRDAAALMTRVDAT